MWVYLAFAVLATLPVLIREVARLWQRLARKQPVAVHPQPDWRELFWRVGLVSVIAPAVLVLVLMAR